MKYKKGDTVCVNERGAGEGRLAWIMGTDYRPTLQVGEIAEVIVTDNDFTEILFEDGTYDNVFTDWLDLVARGPE